MFWLFQVLLVLHSLPNFSPTLHFPQSSSLPISCPSFSAFYLIFNITYPKHHSFPEASLSLHPLSLWVQDSPKLISGPNANQHYLYFRMKHNIFCVIQTGTLSKMNNTLSLREEDMPTTFLYFQWPLGKWTALS